MQTIRLDRVLMVTNSSIAQSNNNAIEYIALRGLVDRRMAFNLGTLTQINRTALLSGGSVVCQTAPYAGLTFMAAFAAYYRNNEIDAVIFSTHMPCRVFVVNPPPPSNNIDSTLESYASQAASLESLTYIDFRFFNNGYVAPKTTSENVNVIVENWRPGEIKNKMRIIPHGRLGCPEYTATNITELSNPALPYPIWKFATMQALWRERKNNRSNGWHVLTNKINYEPNVSTKQNSFGYDLIVRSQYPYIQNESSSDLSPASGGYFNVAGPLFAACFAYPFNVSGWSFFGSLQQSFTCAPGAWGYIYTSFTGPFGISLLLNGASAALLTYAEPGATGIPRAQELFAAIFEYQIPIMLAAFLANSRGYGYSCCGDPLYAPYAHSSIRPLQFSGILQ